MNKDELRAIITKIMDIKDSLYRAAHDLGPDHNACHNGLEAVKNLREAAEEVNGMIFWIEMQDDLD